jgi:hypothetical protein
MIDRAWISLVTAVGAFAVGLLCIYLGYDFFKIGATGGFKLSASHNGSSVGLESIVPGLGFAFFGFGVACWALSKLIKRDYTHWAGKGCYLTRSQGFPSQSHRATTTQTRSSSIRSGLQE